MYLVFVSLAGNGGGTDAGAGVELGAGVGADFSASSLAFTALISSTLGCAQTRSDTCACGHCCRQERNEHAQTHGPPSWPPKVCPASSDALRAADICCTAPSAPVPLPVLELASGRRPSTPASPPTARGSACRHPSPATPRDTSRMKWLDACDTLD